MQGLLGFDYDELSTEDQISFDMFRWNHEIHPIKRYFYRKHFVLSHMGGPQNLKTPLFTRAHTINSLEDAEAYGDDRRTLIIEREAAQAIDETQLVASEPVTVVLSQAGYGRAAKGHEIDPETLSYRSGDAFLASAQGRSNQQAMFIDSTGRV